MTIPRSIPASILLLLVPGCLTFEQIAPPIDARMHSVLGDGVGFELGILEHGRRLYLTRCAACHLPEPIWACSPTRWEIVLDDMIPRAHLDEREADSLRAYVRAARRLVGASAPTGDDA